jgi:hypothetical protein
MAKKAKKRSLPSAAAKPPQAMHARDSNLLGHDAADSDERRAVLVDALANAWAAEDIHTIERIDQDGWHGWAMWPMA